MMQVLSVSQDRKVHLKDHQGNTGVVADKDGNVEETNAYNSFGGTFTSADNVQISITVRN